MGIRQKGATPKPGQAFFSCITALSRLTHQRFALSSLELHTNGCIRGTRGMLWQGKNKYTYTKPSFLDDRGGLVV